MSWMIAGIIIFVVILILSVGFIAKKITEEVDEKDYEDDHHL